MVITGLIISHIALRYWFVFCLFKLNVHQALQALQPRVLQRLGLCQRAAPAERVRAVTPIYDATVRGRVCLQLQLPLRIFPCEPPAQHLFKDFSLADHLYRN